MKNIPEVKKIFHVLETTAGPFAEYENYNIANYWYNPESTIVYTNMNVFDNLRAIDSLGKVLNKNEKFCVADFAVMPFNENNLKRIMSESRLLSVDTVVDNKVQYGGSILLYILKYGVND